MRGIASLVLCVVSAAAVTTAVGLANSSARPSSCRDRTARVHVGSGSLAICGSVRQVAFVDRRHGWVLAVADCATDLGARIYATSDGGRSWRGPWDAGVVNCAAGSGAYMRPRGTQDLSVVTTLGNACDSEAVRTLNGGRRWYWFSLPWCGGDLVFVTRSHGWYAGTLWGASGPLYETSDGGRSWHVRRLARPAGFNALAPCLVRAPRFRGSRGTFPAFVRSKSHDARATYRTSDAGRHWVVTIAGSPRRYGHEIGLVPWKSSEWDEWNCPSGRGT